MSVTKRTLVLFALVLLFLVSWTGAPNLAARQVEGQTEAGALQEETEPEKIVGAPRDIKEKTAILVFVIWMWVSVLVLVNFLRLKIKEADRLYQLRFFSAKKN